MPIYRIRTLFHGYAIYEVEAMDEEDAREQYYGGDMEFIEEEYTDSELDSIECTTDENDIEHHRRRRRGNV